MSNFAPESCHAPLLQNAPRALRFREGADFNTWRGQMRDKLTELLGLPFERVPLEVRIESETQRDGYIDKRFVFTSEANADVPCHLLVPDTGHDSYPVVICLQGHTTGMHISLGQPKSESDAVAIAGGRDFGLQAVREGYAALVLEQRCFGERADSRPKEIRGVGHGCHHPSMAALLLGRTMIGERVWDVSRAIDALSEFPEIDTTRIACMGNSGGGTITFFAACMDERIAVAMPSCYVCTFRDSIGSIDHCTDNYIPGILRHFEMGDLAGLIAPRPLVVVAGQHDKIFPIDAVVETFELISEIYAAAGVPDECQLVVGEAGHQFYPEQAWPVFRGLSGW